MLMAKEYKEQRKQALQALHDAAQIGDISTVRSIFDAHKEFSPNITRKGNNTIIHTALFHNQEGILLDYLIQKGADVNYEL
jgi:ankyrin repeat protein